ncbi:uncharacterized protein LOC119737447 [Patiria miniata]|uniref:Myb/SANT-like DNA-binding domain-containing protein n=1 Tax=Patiria miniata TaxID=46514 RepID=A0A914AUJ3_PATMI|nr:uncharacterized protein LOC119737447 [Patiria miniata]
MAASGTTLNLSSGKDNIDGWLYTNGRQPHDIEMMRTLNGQHTKRERSQNWEQTEKFVLVRLVQQRLAVIEDKAADTDAVQRRKQAWREIHAEFTAKIGSRAGRVSRSIQRIREQWRRMKYWARHELDVYLETRVEVNGKVRYSTRKPNELAQYINGMMAAIERTNHGHRVRTVRSYLRTADDDLQRDLQDADLHPQSQLSSPDPQPDFHPEQGIVDTAHETKLKEDDIPDAMETPQVKQESVELLDEDESGVTMVTLPSIQLSDVHSPPCQSMSQQVIRVDSINGHASSSNSTLPSWAREFPEIVGESADPRPTHDVDNDEDESDFLDDSDDDEMLGSYSDWGRDVPVTDTTATRLTTMESNSRSKLEKQQQLHARWEFKRRMQMMEEEHARRMQILEIHKETAQMKKKLVFRQLKKSRAPSASVSNPYGRRVPLQR